jgi:hypothetical protein
VDSRLVTSGVNMVGELCESHVGAWSKEGEDTEPEPTVVPNFAEVHTVLMKVKSSVYAHRNSDSDRDSVLSLERLFLKLRRKVSTKQLSITVFFTRISSFN